GNKRLCLFYVRADANSGFLASDAIVANINVAIACSKILSGTRTQSSVSVSGCIPNECTGSDSDVVETGCAATKRLCSDGRVVDACGVCKKRVRAVCCV